MSVFEVMLRVRWPRSDMPPTGGLPREVIEASEVEKFVEGRLAGVSEVVEVVSVREKIEQRGEIVRNHPELGDHLRCFPDCTWRWELSKGFTDADEAEAREMWRSHFQYDHDIAEPVTLTSVEDFVERFGPPPDPDPGRVIAVRIEGMPLEPREGWVLCGATVGAEGSLACDQEAHAVGWHSNGVVLWNYDGRS